MPAQQRDYPTTVNGRKKGELLSYGIMLCATPHISSLTEMVLSCANISVKYFTDGCPVLISMNKNDIMKGGNSARSTTLRRQIQDAVIERAHR